MGEAGSSLTFNDGVKNSEEKLGPLTGPAERRSFWEGIPAIGSSRCREIAFASRMRNPSAPSRKTWLSVFNVPGNVGQGAVMHSTTTLTLESETNEPPTINAASAFCATPQVEHKRTRPARKTALRLTIFVLLA